MALRNRKGSDEEARIVYVPCGVSLNAGVANHRHYYFHIHHASIFSAPFRGIGVSWT